MKKLKQLNQSSEILEIRTVDPYTVSRYRQAMRAGAVFPKITIEKGTNIIVSGNHRFQAYMEEYGENHEIPVTEKTYKTQADLIEEAIKDNITHGKPMDGIGRRRAVLKLSELGRKPEQIANLLGVSVRRVEQIGSMIVYVRGEGKKREIRPAKAGADIIGKTITQKQYAEHIKRDRGVPARQMASQLTRWLNNGWIDLTDRKNQVALDELLTALESRMEIA